MPVSVTLMTKSTTHMSKITELRGNFLNFRQCRVSKAAFNYQVSDGYLKLLPHFVVDVRNNSICFENKCLKSLINKIRYLNKHHYLRIPKNI